MYDMKALYEAHSVEEAVRLRLEHPEAQIIAGGTDVLVQMREGRRAGKELISIQKVDEIRGICMDEQENIRIGSLTIANPVMFLAADRELAEEAWAGDIIGIPNHGQLRIGDALTEGESLRFTGIPSFAPELLQSAGLLRQNFTKAKGASVACRATRY